MGGPVLRVYDPAECDADGVPLDWERCRACKGSGRDEVVSAHHGLNHPCRACGGHGSLRAAALDAVRGVLERHHDGRVVRRADASEPTRCEGCGHPMSDGTTEDPDRIAETLRGVGNESVEWWAWEHLRRGNEPPLLLSNEKDRFPLHWSPCDEGCRHEFALGPCRLAENGTAAWWDGETLAGNIVRQNPLVPIEASWRQVDVRTLGWPHDLRPEQLAILCLRCWAVRASSR